MSINKTAIKIQKLFKPFINRISVNIEDRIRYSLLLKKLLNIQNNKNKCIKIYKIVDGNPIYRIGNNIILKKRIGSDSAHAIVFLSSFRIKPQKIFKYACKVVIINDKILKDLEIQKILTKAIVKCPHFPILYGSLICDNNSYDSFVKSNSKDLSIKNDVELYPEIIQKGKRENKSILITFNELANGDLEMFLKNPNIKNSEILNTLGQMFMSIMFYHQETKMIHDDLHWNNFLYHKIKKGGYFYYKILGKDYYLKNIGYLWIIWDYENSIPFEINEINKKRLDIFKDYYYSILYSFLPYKSKKSSYKLGWNKISHINNNEKINKIMQDIYKKIININVGYSIENLKIVINIILNILLSYKILLSKIPKKSKIINEIPYIIH
jgi:hypothetical protein